MELQVDRRARFWAQVIAWVLVLALTWSLVSYTLLQLMGIESRVGVPDGAVEILKWATVASFGLASVCFSFYRTLDQPVVGWNYARQETPCGCESQSRTFQT